MYCTDPCSTGFRGARRDANTGGPDVQQQPADQDIDKGGPCLDAAAEDGRRGSNVYEVSPWLWQFGRGKPRLGGLTIEETAKEAGCCPQSIGQVWEGDS